MYVLMEKQVVDLGIIKTYSLLQHETIKKSCIQVIGKAGLLFQCSDTRNEAGLFCCICLFGEGRVFPGIIFGILPSCLQNGIR